MIIRVLAIWVALFPGLSVQGRNETLPLGPSRGSSQGLLTTTPCDATEISKTALHLTKESYSEPRDSLSILPSTRPPPGAQSSFTTLVSGSSSPCESSSIPIRSKPYKSPASEAAPSYVVVSPPVYVPQATTSCSTSALSPYPSHAIAQSSSQFTPSYMSTSIVPSTPTSVGTSAATASFPSRPLVTQCIEQTPFTITVTSDIKTKWKHVITSFVTVYQTTFVTSLQTLYRDKSPVTAFTTTKTLPASTSIQTTTLPPSLVCQAGTTHVTNFNYGNFTTTIGCCNKTQSTSRTYQCPSFCPYTQSTPCIQSTTTKLLPPVFFPPTTVTSTSIFTTTTTAPAGSVVTILPTTCVPSTVTISGSCTSSNSPILVPTTITSTESASSCYSFTVPSPISCPTVSACTSATVFVPASCSSSTPSICPPAIACLSSVSCSPTIVYSTLYTTTGPSDTNSCTSCPGNPLPPISTIISTVTFTQPNNGVITSTTTLVQTGITSVTPTQSGISSTITSVATPTGPENNSAITVTSTVTGSCNSTVPHPSETTTPVIEPCKPCRDYFILFILFLILFVITLLLLIGSTLYWWRLRHRCRCFTCQMIADQCACPGGPLLGSAAGAATGAATGAAVGGSGAAAPAASGGGYGSSSGTGPPAPNPTPGPSSGGYGTAY
ncbi:uncharacterized protein BP5553_03144 [Venustampulla echinocandica]|uniref:Uncharacterized protein n=1 Tax=Venustampulla echinocandica TaxID=2656787 RepID=A0A370TTG9_9HELO|nr:uncharacterized protein BP5553_03144 [Venustampulla echinocandica]RDL38804.1 hypothetical protein BP5553_03144 [Venustampulla echinocandica]